MKTMMKRTFLAWGALAMLTCSAFGQQNYWQRFSDEFQRKDTVKLKEILLEWQADSPDDADLHASWFNYCLMRSMNQTMQVTETPPADPNTEAMVLTDSLGNEVGYMYSTVEQDPTLLEQAYQWLDKGIRKHPDRLDLRFGKMATLLNEGNYDRFLTDAKSALQHSRANGNNWKWTLDEQMSAEKGKETLLTGMQDYFAACFDTNNATADSAASVLVHEVLNLYPDDMWFRTNQATIHFIKGELDIALEKYLALLKDYPLDTILLGNIAHIYVLKGDKQAAILCYKEILKTDDEAYKEFAKQRIAELSE